mmetsp:Transcript_8693/g.13927  ORF Transcript_8693/g.13927 Transcript_8693/m.13927 type:complete len:252 (+) Transcript_8693:1-756(+)
MGKLAGVVRFKGETKFAGGEWFGIELDAIGMGKNDGSVQGVYYFQCQPAQGIFVRRSSLLPDSNVATNPEGSSLREMGTTSVVKGDTPTSAPPQAPEPKVPSAKNRSSTTTSTSVPISYPKHWKRRASVHASLDEDICVQDHAEMVAAIRNCSVQVQRLHGVVGRLSTALDDASLQEKTTLDESQQVERPSPEALERWLNEAAGRLEKRVEERLGSSLERQVVSAISGPIAELRAAALEVQRSRSGLASPS